ncbi:MAG: AAA family ATPase [Candidatus Thermoplasmatota archaeon]
MNKVDLLPYLRNPSFYGSSASSVEIIQTHISVVALTGPYAYKVKKPVNFGFLDFSTLEKRKFYCEEEIRLNRRLCPDIYLSVLPITQQNGAIVLNGTGKPIEYVVKMKQFPQQEIMTYLLKQGKIDEGIIDILCSKLVDFYTREQPTDEISSYGSPDQVRQNIDENFEQTKAVVGSLISPETYAFIKTTNDAFFKNKKDVFHRRIKQGYIRDCHGDLHSGNIVVSGANNIYIFDCIEFNKRFRFIDVASDIGFLAMDLDYQNHPYLASFLITDYVKKSGDTGIFDLLNFYKSYRAYVRGKVTGFQLQDPKIPEHKKQELQRTAQRYFTLSEYYALLFSLDVAEHTPCLFVVGGLSGTGKSTVAQKIAVDYHACYLNSDIIRKQLAGIDTYERHHDAFNKGLYEPKNVDATYEKMITTAAETLQRKENVVLDATFQKRKHRDMVVRLSQDLSASLIIIQCVCPDEEVKKRLESRLEKKSVSDGRWEIYLKQKETFEAFSSKDHVYIFDTSNEQYEYRFNFFKTIAQRLSKV